MLLRSSSTPSIFLFPRAAFDIVPPTCPLPLAIRKHSPPSQRHSHEIKSADSGRRGEDGRSTAWIHLFTPSSWCLPCASCCRVPALPQRKAISAITADCSLPCSSADGDSHFSGDRLAISLAAFERSCSPSFGIRCSLFSVRW